MLLRYLEEATLKKSVKVKQSNGYPIDTYSVIGVYKVQRKELTDDLNANIYGADVYKMIRIKSINQELEDILIEKSNNSSDNISLYYIYLKNKKYKIKSVNESGINIELIGVEETPIVSL